MVKMYRNVRYAQNYAEKFSRCHVMWWHVAFPWICIQQMTLDANYNLEWQSISDPFFDAYLMSEPLKCGIFGAPNELF